MTAMGSGGDVVGGLALFLINAGLAQGRAPGSRLRWPRSRVSSPAGTRLTLAPPAIPAGQRS